MANSPYVSSRSGRFSWMMQRVSAVLLIFLAFSHFGIQHFTSDAVSTGLTVAKRMNNPWWQAYYVIFVVLALYHGINGVLGIIYDYAPRPLLRGTAAIILWTTAFIFATMGIINITTPKSVAELKLLYVSEGFPVGETSGSPPTPFVKSYDATREIRELHLLAYYLDKHTHRNDFDTTELSAVFNASLNDSDAAVDEKARQSGIAFDDWAMNTLLAPAVEQVDRDRSYIFSNSREFAVWALNVRRRNAERRNDSDTLKRLTRIPAYNPGLF